MQSRNFMCIAVFLCFLPVAWPAPAQAVKITLPDKKDAVRFAVIGDSGTGGRPQYEIAALMSSARKQFPFEFVLMLGDNIYGSKTPADFKRKFEDPYHSLLQANVKFYASLGNHDETVERYYKPFNMNGKLFYSFKRGNSEFFALDSSYMDREQLDWLTKSLTDSHAEWKICFFHKPLYSDGRTHGPDHDLRKRIEPLLDRNGVSVVFAGHDHVYERLKPQNGILYFVVGNSGQLRFHNLRRSPETAVGFDTDRTFALVEIAGDELYYQVIAGAGETVDSGEIPAETPSTK